MSIDRSLIYLKGVVGQSKPMRIEDIYFHLVSSFDAMFPYCAGRSYGAMKFLMLGFWYREDKPVVPVQAREYIESIEIKSLQRACESFLYWAELNKDEPEINPYRHIIAFLVGGGRYTRFEENMLDVHDEFGETFVFPLLNNIERLTNKDRSREAAILSSC